MNLTELLNSIKSLLNDLSYDFWDRAFLISAINEAADIIIRTRKDAHIISFDIGTTETLTPNPITLPVGTQSLISLESIEYNGKLFVAKQNDKKTLDSTTPNWLSATGEPEFYIYDFEKPKELWFYPQLNGIAKAKISILLDDLPLPEADATEVEIDGATVNIDDLTLDIDKAYRVDVINYAMFRALSVDGGNGAAKANNYLIAFSNNLGIKTKSDLAYQVQDKRIKEDL